MGVHLITDRCNAVQPCAARPSKWSVQYY